MNFAWRIYRRLAQAFPHEFKLAYGTGMMQLGGRRRERGCQKAWSRRIYVALATGTRVRR
jgi:hypothetical protein